MAGSSDPDAASAARQLRHRALVQIQTSLLRTVRLLRDNAIQREQSLHQEWALQRDHTLQVQGNLHQELELLGRIALPKERDRLQGLMYGTERLRAAIGQRRAEMQQHAGQLRAYVSALQMVEDLMTGNAVMSGLHGGTGAGPRGL